jgi:signal transduction histidine kinase
MPQGGTITFRTRTQDQSVLLEIEDTGTGMTEEVRQRCLEPFFTTKGEGGSGLGLAMIYGIIQRLHGGIEIETLIDRGTKFRIRLPYLDKKESTANQVPMFRSNDQPDRPVALVC